VINGLREGEIMTEFSSLMSLNGKSAIVTGAATGIGREIANLFVQAGANVAAGDLNEKELGIFAAEAQRGGGECFAQIMDVADAASVKHFFAATEERFGGVDILVNSAGIYPKQPFVTTDVAFWDRVINVNLRGVFLTMQAAVIAMKKRGGGSIVNISSVNSMKACIFDNIHYGASKAGVNSLTVSVALEFAGDNIRSNAVLPGGVMTAQAALSVQEMMPRGPFTQPGRIPLGGVPAGPAEIANAVLYLASDASRYVTGQLLAVDGGFLVS
jgi:NAD(P)-dependent dehydrogenase (short-subunit alcohol dehydrogenase family)